MKQLFHKFLRNECSAPEIEQIISYIKMKGKDEDFPTVEEVLLAPLTHQLISEADADKIFSNILSKEKTPTIGIWPIERSFYGRVAASIIFLLTIASLVFLLFRSQEIKHRTAFGEVKTIQLPDGSTVVLNGNSVITYPSSWKGESKRRVKIEGEAFFSVIHTKDNQRFIVQTNDEFSVEVLGTKFNVLHRRGRAEVVLNEGKVKVNIRKSDSLQHITMKPGESVSYEEGTRAIERIKVIPEDQSSWRNSKLVLDNSSMAEVILRIEETYGVQVKVTDKEVLNLKLWGTVPCNSLTNLLKGIEASFDLRIEQKGNVITITKSPLN